MNIYKIKKIEIISYYKNYHDCNYEVGRNGITKIIDNTVDSDNVYIRQFNVMKDNTLYKEIIGCPVIIEYFQGVQ